MNRLLIGGVASDADAVTLQLELTDFLAEKLSRGRWSVYSNSTYERLQRAYSAATVARRVIDRDWSLEGPPSGLRVNRIDFDAEYERETGQKVSGALQMIAQGLPPTDRFVPDDGGRRAAGYPDMDDPKDCSVRAIAIATGMDYRLTHELIDAIGKTAALWCERDLKHTSASDGVDTRVIKKVLGGVLGWEYHAPKSPRFRLSSLPPGRAVVNIQGHVCAVVNRVIHDTWDCSDGGRVRISGYWAPPSNSAAGRSPATSTPQSQPRESDSK